MDGASADAKGKGKEVPAPRPIVRLSQEVVNRIAAGEIIQRPSSLLKELLENALDSGASTVKIVVKQGGLKSLSIQDNGCGIPNASLPLLCERYTTSKLRSFSDLSSLSTYGFRGEALASISHVAHLTVTTKTRESAAAWKAAYEEGKLVPIKQGGKAEAIPTAGNNGTMLLVEDLFYNVPTRRSALKSPSDEYNRLITLVGAYAIHNSPGVGFSLRRSDSSATNAGEVSTKQDTPTKDVISLLHGPAVGKEVVELPPTSSPELGEVRGWVSTPSHTSGKRSTFLVFVNHRLVSFSPLRKALEALYATILPRGAHPWAYIALQVDPARVDVNVHPTKEDVQLEDEQEVIGWVCEQVTMALESKAGQRTYTVQTLLPGASTMGAGSSSKAPFDGGSGAVEAGKKKAKSVPNPSKMVRMDAKTQTLDSMFAEAGASNEASFLLSDDEEDDEDSERPSKVRKVADGGTSGTQAAEKSKSTKRKTRVSVRQSECSLRSIGELRKEVLASCDGTLAETLKDHVWVGVVDLDRGLSMVQHRTKLYLLNHSSLSEELFYQLALRQFGEMGKMKLDPAPSIEELVLLAAEWEGLPDPADTDSKREPRKVAKRVRKMLVNSKAMLEEYFSVKISASGALEALPIVLPGYLPQLDKLPLFLLRLGVCVDWENEKPCFEGFLKELASFYSLEPLDYESTPEDEDDAEKRQQQEQAQKARREQVEYTLMPAVRTYLSPSKRLMDEGDAVLVTSLERLYRVFERC